MKPPAARETVRASVASLSGGQELDLALHRVRGAQPGPRLGVVAGIHGDEPLGIEIVRRFLLTVQDETFAGELTAIPVANPCAFATLTRHTPVDAGNLNRSFPGNPDGTLSEQIAHVVAAELLERCDYLVDVHSGGPLATVDYVYADADEQLAKAFGCEVLYRGAPPPGSLAEDAAGRGIPTLIVELGGGRQHDERFVWKGMRGLRNVMKHLRMLGGEPELPPAQTFVSELADLKPHHGGLMLSRYGSDRLGDLVPAGEELAQVVSPYSFETLEQIVAPFEPTLLVLVRDGVTKVDPGDYGFIVANGDTAAAAA